MTTNSNSKIVLNLFRRLNNPKGDESKKLSAIEGLYPVLKDQLSQKQVTNLVECIYTIALKMEWGKPEGYLQAAQLLQLLGTKEALGRISEMEQKLVKAITVDKWALPNWILQEMQTMIPGRLHEAQIQKLLAKELKKPIHPHDAQNQYVEPILWASDHGPLYSKGLVLLGLEKVLNDGHFDELDMLHDLEEALNRIYNVRLPSLCSVTSPVYILCAALLQRVKDLIEVDALIRSQQES